MERKVIYFNVKNTNEELNIIAVQKWKPLVGQSTGRPNLLSLYSGLASPLGLRELKMHIICSNLIQSVG